MCLRRAAVMSNSGRLAITEARFTFPRWGRSRPEARRLWCTLVPALFITKAGFAQTWESPHWCGGEAGLYRSDNGRHAWVRKTGSLSRVGGVRGSFHVLDLVYDDLQAYFLVGLDTARMTFREDLRKVEQEAIEWNNETTLPSSLHILGESGLPGPILIFVGCESAPAPVGS